MAAATIEIETVGVARRPTPPRRPAKTSRFALDAVRLMLIGVFVTLGFIGLTGIAAELAAIGPPPVGGPTPGFP
jgi:hypothetical protein